MAAGGGPIQASPAVRARLRERGVLGQEAVARVDRLGAGRRGRREDRVDPQVALGGRPRADAHGLVGRPDVRRPPSASEYTATVRTPSRRQVRMTRSAISPRLATRTDANT